MHAVKALQIQDQHEIYKTLQKNQYSQHALIVWSQDQLITCCSSKHAEHTPDYL